MSLNNRSLQELEKDHEELSEFIQRVNAAKMQDFQQLKAIETEIKLRQEVEANERLRA